MEITETAKKVLKKRYYLPNELKWENVCHRCSDFFGKDEKEKQIFYDLMFNGYFLPNSPALMNAGTNINSFSACFVLPIEDNIESIYKFYMNAAKISKSGGGVGANYSKIRARNSTVNSTNGVASGPLSFAEVQDKSTDIIKQGGRRRGANMMVLNCDHDDIFEFIDYKNDKTKLNNFNLSVKISDDFMNKISQDGKERKIWNKICERAWSCGEPGVLFGDTAERANTVPHLGKLESTNPCQPSYATVLTPNGISTIGKIKIGDVIWSGKQWTKIANKWRTGVKDVYKYTTTSGRFIGTKNHKVIQNLEKIEVKNAKSIDWNICDKKEFANDLNNQTIIDGLVIGDGSVHEASNNLIYLCIGENDKDYFNSEIKNFITLYRPGIKKYAYEINTTISSMELPKTYERKIPDRFYFGNEVIKRSFLRGLFTANGSVVRNRVTLKQSSKIMVEQVQDMLSSLGIYSYITTNKSKKVSFKNGDYQCRESYDLNISSNRDLFKKYIGFIQKYKTEKIIGFGHPKNITSNIKEIAYLGKEEVFDLTVEADEHTYWTGGCLVSNCGEQWLLDYESCSLGSINVGNFVVEGKIDYKSLQKVVENAVLYMNRVLDKTIMPIPECQTALEMTRKIGLGIMGLHDLLIQLDVCYDSKEARDYASDVMSFIERIAIEKSIELGESEGVYKGYKEGCYKRRNANLTTIAPTGTLSMIADCSSGIEPYYSVITIKNVLDGEKLVLINKWFEKSLRKIKSEEETKLIIEKVKEKGTINIEEVPEQLKQLFKGANEISPTGHVLMQAALQKYVDSSISKTINLPSSATIEDVKKIYLLAYREGCKGVTVYRDGSRDSQVLTNTNSKDSIFTRPDNINFTFAPKRPKELPAELYHCNIKGTPWVVIVGLLNEKPYEVFAGELNDLAIPKNCKNGIVKKTKSGTYSLIVKTKNSEMEFKEIANNLMTAEQKALTRMISLSLRHGVHYEFIVNQLKKASGDITDFASVVNRVLRTYISQYVYEKEKKCLECGSKIIYVEGCEKCSVCGLSKCG